MKKLWEEQSWPKGATLSQNASHLNYGITLTTTNLFKCYFLKWWVFGTGGCALFNNSLRTQSTYLGIESEALEQSLGKDV